MDEPLSNLDAKLRNQMRAEIIKLRKVIDTTFVYVTHDQTEAMTLGDRIVIMKVKLSESKQTNLKRNAVEPKDVVLGVRPPHMSIAKDKNNAIAGTLEVFEDIHRRHGISIRSGNRKESGILIPEKSK